MRVLDSDRNSEAVISNSRPINATYPGVPVRRPFPPFFNSQLPPQRPKDTAFITPPSRHSTTTAASAQKKLLHPTAANSSATGAAPAGHSSTTTAPKSSESVSDIQKIVPTKSSEQPFGEPTGGPANRTGDGLDLITAFLPLLAAICFAPIAGLVFWVLHHRCQKGSNRNLMKSFSQKIASIDKSGSSETSISSVSGELDYNGALFAQIRTNRGLKNRIDTNSYTSTFNIPVGDEKWEFPRHHLHFMGILGEGCFGQVWKCEAFNIFDNNAKDIVAVKTLKENASEKEKKDLLTELEIMKMLEPHPNVVTLLGSCTDRDPVFLIMEYVPFGKLQSFLRESRERNSDLYYGNLHACSNRLSARDLTLFAYQVAKAMEYLSSKGVSATVLALVT